MTKILESSTLKAKFNYISEEKTYRLDQDGKFRPDRKGNWRMNRDGYPLPIDERIGFYPEAVESAREEEKKAMQREADFRQGRVDVARSVQKIIDDATKSDREKLEEIFRITEALEKSFGGNIHE